MAQTYPQQQSQYPQYYQSEDSSLLQGQNGQNQNMMMQPQFQNQQVPQSYPPQAQPYYGQQPYQGGQQLYAQPGQQMMMQQQPYPPNTQLQQQPQYYQQAQPYQAPIYQQPPQAYSQPYPYPNGQQQNIYDPHAQLQQPQMMMQQPPMPQPIQRQHAPPLQPDEEYYLSENSIDQNGQPKVKKRRRHQQEGHTNTNVILINPIPLGGGGSVVVGPQAPILQAGQAVNHANAAQQSGGGGGGVIGSAFGAVGNLLGGDGQEEESEEAKAEKDKKTKPDLTGLSYMVVAVGSSVKECCCGICKLSETLCSWCVKTITHALTCPCQFVSSCIRGFWRCFIRDCCGKCCPDAVQQIGHSCNVFRQIASRYFESCLSGTTQFCDKAFACCQGVCNGEQCCKVYESIAQCCSQIGGGCSSCVKAVILKCSCIADNLRDFTGCCKGCHSALTKACIWCQKIFCDGVKIEAWCNLCCDKVGRFCCCIIESGLKLL